MTIEKTPVAIAVLWAAATSEFAPLLVSFSTGSIDLHNSKNMMKLSLVQELIDKKKLTYIDPLGIGIPIPCPRPSESTGAFEGESSLP
jgi:hypothetical protein